MEIKLKATDVAEIVNSDDRIKQAVISLYLQKNAPKLTIEDLPSATTATQEAAAADSIVIQGGDLSVPIGGDAEFDIGLNGPATTSVKSADERIATVALSDGKLHIHGISGASTTLTIIKGEQTEERRIMVG